MAIRPAATCRGHDPASSAPAPAVRPNPGPMPGGPWPAAGTSSGRRRQAWLGVLQRGGERVHEFEGCDGESPLVLVAAHHRVRDMHFDAETFDIALQARVGLVEDETVDQAFVVTR